MAALGMFPEYQHPHLGLLRSVAQPVTFNGAKEVIQAPPPMLGEHTREILALAGCDTQTIERYIGAGIARCHEARPVTS